MQNGGTGIITVTTDADGAPGGTTIPLSSSAPLSVVVPASVVLRPGVRTTSFRVRADATTPTTAIVTAMFNGPGTATVNVIQTAPTPDPAPNAPQLLINEILADPGVVSGDANCDSVVNSSDDEFVEIVNLTNGPLDLTGVTLSDAAAVRFTFPQFVLGPREPVVVFARFQPAAAPSSPHCVGVSATRIGDATAFATMNGLLLNNTSDTVSLGKPPATMPFSSVTYGTEAGNDQSITRSPDGALVPLIQHTSAPSAATDRVFSPGSRLSGLSWAEATP